MTIVDTDFASSKKAQRLPSAVLNLYFVNRIKVCRIIEGQTARARDKREDFEGVFLKRGAIRLPRVKEE